MSGSLIISKADVLASLRVAAADEITRFLASNDAKAIRVRLVEEASAVSAEDVGRMWNLTPRQAREALKKAKVGLTSVTAPRATRWSPRVAW